MKKKLVAVCMGLILSMSLLTACGGDTTVTDASVSETTKEENQVVDNEVVSDVTEETDNESTEEVAEETVEETVSKYEYKLIFAEGAEVGINAPEGYSLHVNNNGLNYSFVNVRNDSVMIMPFTAEYTSEDSVNAYNEYLENGTWDGFWSFIPETFDEEVKIEVPGGNALIIKATGAEIYSYEHAFITIGEMQFYVSRNIEKEAAVNELTTEELVRQMFTEKDFSNALYTVENVDVDLSNSTYENYIDTLDTDSKILFGFNLPFEGFTRQDESWNANGKVVNPAYRYKNADGDVLHLTYSSNLDTQYSNIAAFRQFMNNGEYNTEATMFSYDTYETGNLLEMKMGGTFETSFGTMNVVYSLWKNPSSVVVREVALFSVNEFECIISYDRTVDSTVTSLESYEGCLDTMIPAMFN